jgi:hypothetical protein
MTLAIAQDRVLVTTDTDFTILALSGAAGPSVLLLRGIGDSADERVAVILDALPRVERERSEGAVVVIEPDRFRIRHRGSVTAGSRSASGSTDPSAPRSTAKKVAVPATPRTERGALAARRPPSRV